jgi:ABC-type ATPase involved in cell division
LPKQARRKKMVAALEQVDLGNKIDAFGYSLSGGEQQRIALASAILKNARSSSATSHLLHLMMRMFIWCLIFWRI